MIKFSVTDAHLCYRCPRLLAYRKSGNSHAWKVGLKGTGEFPGTLFHNQIAKPFHQKLSSPKNSALKRHLIDILADTKSNLADMIQSLIAIYIMNPMLKQESSKLTPDNILALAKGVGLWSRHLADFLSKYQCNNKNKIAEHISSIFCDPEKKIKQPIKINENFSFELTGIFDMLLMDMVDKEAVIMEFKCLKSDREDEDFMQIALYGLLIRRATGIDARGVILYLEEEPPEAVYSAENLKKIESNLFNLLENTAAVIESVPKKGKIELQKASNENLCIICPFNGKCDLDWGVKTTVKSSGNKEADEAEKLMNALIDTLNMLKLPAYSDGYILGPRLIRLKIKPDIEKGTTVKKIMNRSQELQIAMCLKNSPLIRAQAGYMSIDVPRKNTTPLTLTEIWETGKKNKPASDAAFPIGMNIDGSVEWADLSDSTMTSILIAGTAGSGKSVFLRAAVIGMAMNAGSDKIRFTLVDPKRVTFTDFMELPHLNSRVIMDIEAAIDMLEKMVSEMEDRYKLFESNSVFDIAEYNRLGNDLAHHVLIIDEYADLMIDSESKKATEKYIQRLSQKGRAAGFHLIISTQRPDARIITPLIKANLQLKVALKVTTATNSQVIIDEPGAERLMGNGDMLVGGAIPLIRLQGAIPTKKEIEAFI